MKNKGYEHFCICLKLLKFVAGGYNLGSGKQLLAIKVSFRVNKPSFRELMSELATRSQKADLYDIISLKIEQLFT